MGDNEFIKRSFDNLGNNEFIKRGFDNLGDNEFIKRHFDSLGNCQFKILSKFEFKINVNFLIFLKEVMSLLKDIWTL